MSGRKRKNIETNKEPNTETEGTGIVQAFNTVISRLPFISQFTNTFNNERNMYKVLGYKSRLVIDDFLAVYARQDIANRIVNAFPKATWRTSPKVTDNKDTDSDSAFDSAWILLAKQLKIFNYLVRLDMLQALGRYGVLMIGVAGTSQEQLMEPLERVNGPQDIVFLRAFSEESAKISKYVTDISDPRFNLPDQYRISTGGQDGSTDNTSMPEYTFLVHHSRIIHVAEELLENEVFGIPILGKVYNRLNDLEKVIGGDAETFWLNARGGMNFNSDKDVSLSPKDAEKLKTEIQSFMHQVTRAIHTRGMDVKMLNATVADPSNHVSVILDLIAGTTGIPKRILIGSERGELASSQDENNWLNRVEERQVNFAEPTVLRRVIDKFMEIGALPAVTEYEVIWENLNALSEKDQAEIAVKKSQAILNYSNALMAGDVIMPPKQFVEELLMEEYKEKDLTTLLSENASEDVDEIGTDAPSIDE